MNGDIESAAREIGWKPKEEFRGDDSKWVDAQTYVSRGENFVPILRADRDKARQEASELRTAVTSTQAALAAAQEAITELKAYHSENTKRQVELAKADLTRRLRQAREDNDVEAEVDIQDQLTEVRKTLAAPPPPVPKPAAAPPAPAAPDPDFSAWEAANPWFRTSVRLRGLTLGIAEELRAKEPTLVGKAFYAKIDAEVAQYLDANQAPNKVDGGGRAGSGGTGGSPPPRARGYSELPAEAKAACVEFSHKLVGPGRAYKDLASWQAQYAKDYFESDES